MHLIKKLKSEKGASLLMAMILMCVFMIIGSIVLTYATVNMGSVAKQEKLMKNMKTLTSAAKVVRSEIKDGSSTINWSIEPTYEDTFEMIMRLAQDRYELDTMTFDASPLTATVKAPGFDDVSVSIESQNYALGIDELSEMPQEHAFTFIRVSLKIGDEACIYLDIKLNTQSQPDGNTFVYEVENTIINNGDAKFGNIEE